MPATGLASRGAEGTTVCTTSRAMNKPAYMTEVIMVTGRGVKAIGFREVFFMLSCDESARFRIDDARGSYLQRCAPTLAGAQKGC